MTISKLLIGNRGEIAIRIARAASDLGMDSVAVYSQDDAKSLHVSFADSAIGLPGHGAAAYLSVKALIDAASSAGCDALHPGYGLLSESPELAQACADAGITFVGPTPETLRVLGDKAAARKLAVALDVPLLPGTQLATSLEEAKTFQAGLKPDEKMMLKALSGGGGRGIRTVGPKDDLAKAYDLCTAEATRAFGNGTLYVEMMVVNARHIEVQILGDGQGNVIHLGERECTLQRHHQKLIEVAPSPGLPATLREQLLDDAVRMAKSLTYSGLGTFEFLVSADFDGRYWFMEANPRVQVEHTVTEETTGVDLVASQIQVAGGASLTDLGLTEPVYPSGCAIQLRLNAETVDATGAVSPSFGEITAYGMPDGPGLRVDGYGYVGYALNPSFDTLLAKIVASAKGNPTAAYGIALRRAMRAVAETSIGGVQSNLGFLHALLRHDAVQQDRIYTRFVEDNIAELIRYSQQLEPPTPIAHQQQAAAAKDPVPQGAEAIYAPLAGLVSALEVEIGQNVAKGQTIAILDAMKMEHVVSAPFAGLVRVLACEAGVAVNKDAPLVYIEQREGGAETQTRTKRVDPDAIPPLLGEELERRARRMDAARPEAVAKRRKAQQRTLRENIKQLCDPDSFIEYGGLAIASQRRRRERKQLEAMSPADGMVTGTATINARQSQFDRRAAVIGYDYTVMAGTQGWANHRKLGRMLSLLTENPLPLVIFAEGGGGRPGDTDQMRSSGLDTRNFANLARLSGKKPIVGIVSGRCFAGNAALLGVSDIIIATENASIGMGGPAMIEGGGLGVFAPEEVGPLSIQEPNGVVDIAVKDETAAVDTAKKYLGFFQGIQEAWACEDQRPLRHTVPENRRLTYDVHEAIRLLCDTGSLLELRPNFGHGIITVLARIEGRPVGIIANNNRHIAGAIDSPAAHKAARFLSLCDTFGLPVVSLCDTPGFMVGPESERTGAVRAFSRLFLAGANLSVPIFTVVLRKGYGLGAMGMAGGSMHETVMTVAWPTAEFGGMGLEGAVRLGYKRELEAIEDPDQRAAKFQELVAKSYEDGRAHNAASFVEIDDVIDPAETRTLIAQSFAGYTNIVANPKGRYLDSW